MPTQSQLEALITACRECNFRENEWFRAKQILDDVVRPLGEELSKEGKFLYIDNLSIYIIEFFEGATEGSYRVSVEHSPRYGPNGVPSMLSELSSFRGLS